MWRRLHREGRWRHPRTSSCRLSRSGVGKPTLAVVSMGRPQGLAPVMDRLPAVLTGYYGGPYQGKRPNSIVSAIPFDILGEGIYDLPVFLGEPI
jgi:hypothetical protein